MSCLVAAGLWLGQGTSAIAGEPQVYREDFSVDSGQWSVIRRGGAIGSKAFAESKIVTDGAKPVQALHVLGAGENAAIGVAVLLPNGQIQEVGTRVLASFRLRTERLEGFTGVGGNGFFLGFASYLGARPGGTDDDGFFAMFRSERKPSILPDFDEGLGFLSSGRKPYVGKEAVAFSAGEWFDVSFEVERQALGFLVTLRVNGVETSALFDDLSGIEWGEIGSLVIAQGGGSDAPADFYLADLKVQRFEPPPAR